MKRTGPLKGVATDKTFYFLGSLLFAFTVFWAYIAFSQYMLIWYGNIPEETEWFLKRQTGDWTAISLMLLFGHFVLPFLLLISRHVKRRPIPLAIIGVPTSVGYGVAAGGTTALQAMLASCANGLTVVNIDHGFGAGYAAALINRRRP